MFHLSALEDSNPLTNLANSYTATDDLKSEIQQLLAALQNPNDPNFLSNAEKLYSLLTSAEEGDGKYANCDMAGLKTLCDTVLGDLKTALSGVSAKMPTPTGKTANVYLPSGKKASVWDLISCDPSTQLSFSFDLNKGYNAHHSCSWSGDFYKEKESKLFDKDPGAYGSLDPINGFDISYRNNEKDEGGQSYTTYTHFTATGDASTILSYCSLSGSVDTSAFDNLQNML